MATKQTFGKGKKNAIPPSVSSSGLWEPKDIEFIFSSYQNFEKRLLDFLRVLPYDKMNKAAWSPDLVSLFLDICGTLDSISRHILGNGQDESSEIDVRTQKGKLVKKKIRNLNVIDFELNLWAPMNLKKSWAVVYLYGLYPNCAMAPYRKYNAQNGWWKIYNALKHNRLDSYQKATLDKIIESLAALFLLLVRYQNEQFTKALIRLDWLDTSVVPEFAHGERFGTKGLWSDSHLFGTHDIAQNIFSQDIGKIATFLGSRKFHKFIGRFNPIPTIK